MTPLRAGHLQPHRPGCTKLWTKGHTSGADPACRCYHPVGLAQGRPGRGTTVAKLYWAACDICNFVGNSYEDPTPANDELGQHMREHATRNESGGGRLEESD